MGDTKHAISQFIDRRTRPKRAVAVDVSERGGAVPGDYYAVERVRASGPLHEHRRRRRPGVLDVVEQAIIIAHDEVQIACGKHKNIQSQHIDRRTRSERAVAVEVSECGHAVPADVDVVEGVRAIGPCNEHRRRRRPGVLGVDELAIPIAHDEVQVACERHET